MRSLIASLRTLVLPWGRTSGRRIILDGVNGDIRIYDQLGDLRIRMGWEGNPDAIYLYPPSAITTADEAHAGRVNSVFYGAAGTTRRVGLEVASPDVVTASRDRAFLEVVSESEDGTIPPRVDIYSDNNRADARLNARTLPRGLLAAPFSSTVADSARAAGVLTDMTRTVDLIGGRTCRVALNTQVTLGTAGVPYALDLDVDGTLVARFWRLPGAALGTLHQAVGSIDYTPPADNPGAVLTVANAPGSGGTITCQPVGAAPFPRTLTVSDIGG